VNGWSGMSWSATSNMRLSSSIGASLNRHSFLVTPDIDATPQEIRGTQRRLCLGAASFLLVTAATVWSADYGYTRSVTPGLVASLVSRFGAEARGRIEAWRDFGRRETGRANTADAVPAAEGLQRINSFLNQVPYKDDIVHWRVEDYWATPAETVGSNGGDCEDYAIAKYFLLKELGVPAARLRMVYVRAGKSARPHMILAYYPQPDAEPLILDNLDDRVRLAGSRPDLAPVYSFNEDDVVLTASGQRTTPQQIRTWRALLDRLNGELLL
jgi:predicted transglutaminase-like cysteine proteinase